MPRSRRFIVLSLAVAAAAFAVWLALREPVGDGIVPKGEQDVISPALVALVSLCTGIVSLLTGLASLVLKVMEIRAKSRS